MFRARPLPSFDDVFRPDKTKSSKVRSPGMQAGICICRPQQASSDS